MRYGFVALFGLAVVVAMDSSVKACGYGMPSPAARFVLADTVLVGKVVAFEHKMLKLRNRRSETPVPHAVAVVKVHDMVMGDERVTHVRVALAQHQVMQPGYEALFFFHQHSEESVLVLSSGEFDYPIAKENNSGFEKQVEMYRRMGKLLRDPEASLQAKNVDDRFLTAALLLTKYRFRSFDYVTPTPKETAIDARQSRLILSALAEADWTRTAADFRLTPRNVFTMLGVGPADGLDFFNLPTNPQREEAMKKWLQQKKETFVIKAFVRS